MSAPTPTPETGPAEGVRDQVVATLDRALRNFPREFHTGGYLADGLFALRGPLAKLLAAEAARVAAVERAERVEGALTGVIAAWDHLPGDQHYSPKTVERWMVDTLAPAFKAARVALAHHAHHESTADALRRENAALRPALEQAEACLSIVPPRSDTAEYLRTLDVVRAALAHRPAPAAGPGPTGQDRGGNGHGR